MSEEILLQVGVKILIRNDKDKYLLLHRSLEKYPEIKGAWDIVGGRVDSGKTLLDNLRREVKEETNLDLKGEPQLIAAQDILRSSGRHVVRLTYVGEATGELKLDTKENDEYKWLSLEELKAENDLDVYFKELIEKKLIK